MDEVAQRRASVPWSPMEVDLKMRQVIEALDDAVLVHKALVEEAANKRHELKQAEAMLSLQARRLVIPEGESKWSEGDKKAWVESQLGDRRLEYDIADAHAGAQRDVINSLRSEADLLRSLARSGRDAFEGPGSGIQRR